MAFSIWRSYGWPSPLIRTTRPSSTPPSWPPTNWDCWRSWSELPGLGGKAFIPKFELLTAPIGLIWPNEYRIWEVSIMHCRLKILSVAHDLWHWFRPSISVTLTFIEFFDISKFDVPERVFHKAVPVECCQWLPGALVTLSVLNCIGVSYSNTLTRLDIHCELVDDYLPRRGDILLLLSDVIRIFRGLHALTRLIYDSSITLHFCKGSFHFCQLIWMGVVSMSIGVISY